MKKLLIPSVLSFVLLLALLMTVAGCGSTSGQTSATVWGAGTDEISAAAKAADEAIADLTQSADIDTPQTLADGVLLAGCDSTSPPFGFLANVITKVDGKDAKTTEIVGFEVDLCAAVAKKLGLESEFVSISFKGLLPALQENTVDIVASAMITAPGRLQQFSATDVHLAADLAIVTRADRPLADLGDLSGKRVGVQLDTSAESLLGETEVGAEVTAYPQVLSAFRDLLSEKLDAVVAQEPICLWILDNDTAYQSDYAVTGRLETDEGYAFWCQKEDTALLDAMNAALQELRTEGVYRLICAKWGLTGN